MLALLLPLLTSAAPEEALVAARQALDELAYKNAVVLAESALKSGQLTSTQVAQAWFVIGLALASIDEQGPAFSIACSVDPTVALPPDRSPKIIAAFNQACSTPTPLSVQVQASRENRSAEITVELNDRLQLVQTLRLTGTPDTTVLSGRPATGKFPCDPQGCSRTLQALDVYGNVLQEVRVAVPALSPARAWYQQPATFLGVTGGILLITAVVFGLQFSANQTQLASIQSHREQYIYADALRANDSSVRSLGLTIGSGTLSLLAAIGVFLTLPNSVQ